MGAIHSSHRHSLFLSLSPQSPQAFPPSDQMRLHQYSVVVEPSSTFFHSVLVQINNRFYFSSLSFISPIVSFTCLKRQTAVGLRYQGCCLSVALLVQDLQTGHQASSNKQTPTNESGSHLTIHVCLDSHSNMQQGKNHPKMCSSFSCESQ